MYACFYVYVHIYIYIYIYIYVCVYTPVYVQASLYLHIFLSPSFPEPQQAALPVAFSSRTPVNAHFTLI